MRMRVFRRNLPLREICGRNAKSPAGEKFPQREIFTCFAGETRYQCKCIEENRPDSWFKISRRNLKLILVRSLRQGTAKTSRGVFRHVAEPKIGFCGPRGEICGPRSLQAGIRPERGENEAKKRRSARKSDVPRVCTFALAHLENMSYHCAISHRGQSTSARNQRNTVSKLFETWPRQAREENNDAAPAKSLEQLSPDELAKRAMYEAFAHWLTLVYRQQNDDKPLAPGTVMDYFGCLINLALHIATERAPGGRLPPSASRFFKCLDYGKGFMNMESAWLRGMKNNMRRRSVALHVDEGNSLDNSATPIFADHVRDCVAAYAKLGSKDAASRKLYIQATWHVWPRRRMPIPVVRGHPLG